MGYNLYVYTQLLCPGMPVYTDVYKTKAWFTILTPMSILSTSTIEMNPIPASTSASTSKDAADVEAVSLKFDAQLSVGVILWTRLIRVCLKKECLQFLLYCKA